MKYISILVTALTYIYQLSSLDYSSFLLFFPTFLIRFFTNNQYEKKRINTVVAPTYHFLEILQINSIQFNISFSRKVSTDVTSASGGGAISTAAAPVKFLLDTVLVIIADIDAAPVQLSSLVILKALGTADKFSKKFF